MPDETEAARKKPYHWFQGASVRELYDRIGANNPDTARLEVRTDGANKMTFRVVAGGGEVAKLESGEDCPDINESHICPPICP